MSKFRDSITFNKLTVALVAAAFFSIACDSAPEAPVSSAATVKATRLSANEKAMNDAFDVPLAKLDGTSLKISDFKGKVVVLDFWATNCGPCVKLVPQLAKLYDRYRGQGLEIIGLTSDEKSDQKLVEDFIKKQGLNYTVAYGNRWVSRAFLKGSEDETGAPPIPQLYVISRDGRVVDHHMGYNGEKDMEIIEKTIVQELR
jgi:thiol-disulfide isomerase/thioredoxin